MRKMMSGFIFHMSRDWTNCLLADGLLNFKDGSKTPEGAEIGVVW